MWTGLTVTLVAGLIGGSVLAPMKYMTRWPFQNSWAIYALWAYLIMPWVVGLATIPHLLSIYGQVSSRSLLICAACGFGWGIAVVLFGVAVHWVGLSLASAIIYGASVAIGSLGPLAFSHSEQLATRQGALIIAGNAVMIVGIVICALAGKKRDEGKKTGEVERGMSDDPARFVKGLTASVLAAILSSLFNIALAYGGEFNRLAVEHGANPLNAANAQWTFTVTFGYLPNFFVSLYRLRNEKLWGAYRLSGGLSHWLLPPLMGLMWIGGTALYGSGAGLLGTLGPVIGWPVYMSTMILVGNFWGWLTGEWAQAPRIAFRLLMAGALVMIVAISLLSAVNR